MKHLLLVFLFVAALPMYSQSGKVEIGIIDSLFFPTLGKKRHVWILTLLAAFFFTAQRV